MHWIGNPTPIPSPNSRRGERAILCIIYAWGGHKLQHLDPLSSDTYKVRWTKS
jgi:hypothetical protein